MRPGGNVRYVLTLPLWDPPDHHRNLFQQHFFFFPYLHAVVQVHPVALNSAKRNNPHCQGTLNTLK